MMETDGRRHKEKRAADRSQPSSQTYLSWKSHQNSIKKLLCFLLVLGDVGIFMQPKHL